MEQVFYAVRRPTGNMKIISESLHSHLEQQNSCGLFNHLFYLRVCSSLPHNSQRSWALEKLGAVCRALVSG